MTTTVRILVVVAALGAGLMGGVFFAFSAFVMPALRRIPDLTGARAMQEINRTAVKPPLMIALFGTFAVCVVVAVAALRSVHDRPSPWLLAAGITYFVGAVMVTAVGNVPLNDRLDKVDLGADRSKALSVWHSVEQSWTSWNHVRTIGCLVASALFVVALVTDN